MHTFYGHQHSCNSVHSSLSGYQLYSSDCFGHVLQWDIRTHSNTSHWDVGPFPVNSITTDTAGTTARSTYIHRVLPRVFLGVVGVFLEELKATSKL